MPQLKVNGTELHYQVIGKGLPVVMIHGLLVGNLTSWYFGAAAELAKSHKVFVYDLRGHGLSEKSAVGYTLRDMVDDLAAFIQAQNLERVSLVGHSYGGLIALHYAVKFPERVERLGVVEAPLPPGRAAELDSFMLKNPTELLQALPAHLRSMVESSNRQAKKFIERLQFLIFETDVIENLRAEGDLDDQTLRALTLPTLLVYGQSSRLVDVGERLAKVLSNAHLQKIPGGHYLPSENAADLSQALAGFLT